MRVAVVLLVCLTAGAASALQCGYVLVTTQVSVPGHDFEPHEYYELMCWESTGGGSTGGGTAGPGGSSTPPPPLPTVRVVSASDQNPHDVALNFQYTGNPSTMTITRNGTVVGEGAPSTIGYYGTLDNMVFDTILTVKVCNPAGCAEDYANVYRTTSRKRAQGVVEAQWADVISVTPPALEIGWVSYPRIFEVEFFHANYSVETVGMRNGYVKHVQSADALFWGTGEPEPEWDVAYRMTPWHSSTPYAETALHYVGCYVPSALLPHQDPRCTMIGEFGHPWYPASGIVLDLNASDPGLTVLENARGDLQLDILP